MSFSEYLASSWSEDLDEIRRNMEYYNAWNEQIYGSATDVLGLWTEAKKMKPPRDDVSDEEKDSIAFASRAEKDAYVDKIRSGFGVDPLIPNRDVDILSDGENNPKTAKGVLEPVPNPLTGERLPVYNDIVHLLPAGLSGCQTCPSHTPECAAACLDVAGRTDLLGGKISGRAKRTLWLAYDKNGFMRHLADSIWRRVRSLEGKLNYGVRLNGTSDIPYESSKYAFVWSPPGPGRKWKRWVKYKADSGEEYSPEDGEPKTLMQHFPHVQFYDYTKVYSRAWKAAPKNRGSGWAKNYHITYSYSELSEPDEVEKLLKAGGNVAMVFTFAGKNPLAWWKREEGRPVPKYSGEGPYIIPKVWVGPSGTKWKVISGDIHDLRFIDEEGVIVGLSAKGDAKYVMGQSAHQVFVVQPTDPHVAFERENYEWRQVAIASLQRRLADSKESLDSDLARFRAEFKEKTGADPTEDDLDEFDRLRWRGPGGQRKHADWIYKISKTPIEQLRKYFQDWHQALRNKAVSIEVQRLTKAAVVEARKHNRKFQETDISDDEIKRIQAQAVRYADALIKHGLALTNEPMRTADKYPPRELEKPEDPTTPISALGTWRAPFANYRRGAERRYHVSQEEWEEERRKRAAERTGDFSAEFMEKRRKKKERDLRAGPPETPVAEHLNPYINRWLYRG